MLSHWIAFRVRSRSIVSRSVASGHGNVQLHASKCNALKMGGAKPAKSCKTAGNKIDPSWVLSCKGLSPPDRPKDFDLSMGGAMSAETSSRENEAEIAQEIKSLLATIVGHASDKTRPMTIHDLHDYYGQLMKLGKMYYAERASQIFSRDKRVRRMSRLLQVIADVLEASRQTTLVSVWRAIIADYMNQAPKFSIE